MSNDKSPMKEYILEQTSRINELLSNAQIFKEKYQDLTQNIITSLNNQLKTYQKDGKRSIYVDIYNLTLEAINWEELQQNIEKMLKSNKNNVNPGTWKKLDKLHAKIELLDDDSITNMFIYCDVEHVKEFQKYRKLAKNEISELLSSLDEFEAELCRYRNEMVKVCLENVQVLFNHHFNYVNDLFHKRTPPKSVVIDGKEIQLKRSQREFITSALKEFMCAHNN